MVKPLSRPHELGRAIGYNLDPSLLVDELRRAPVEQWDDLGSHRALLDYVRNADGLRARGSKRSKQVWLVVKVENKVPVMIDAYVDKRAAKRREKFLRQHLRPGRESVKLVQINLKS